MFELQGKFATAKVFADMADEKAIAQVISLLNQSYAEGSRIRMMPDIRRRRRMHDWHYHDDYR